MANSLFQTLWPNGPLGYLAVGSLKPNQWQFFSSSDVALAEEFLRQGGSTRDMYYTIGSLKSPVLKGRGESADMAHLPCVHMDFDIDTGGKAHKASHYPKSLEELQNFIDTSGLPEPTMLVHSGNGVHAYFVFTEPLSLMDEDESAAAGKLLKDFQLAVNALAAKRGWKFDPTGDLPRILRYPGTLNHKTLPAKPVEIIAESGVYHSRNELESWVGANLPVTQLSGPFNRTAASVRAGNPEDGKPSFDAILAGCDWLKLCVEKPMSEPDWYAFASIVGNCEDGEEIFHRISAQDETRYDADQAASKLAHALESAGPRTCVDIEAKSKCGACADCIFKGKIASPISLGRKGVTEVMLQHDNLFHNVTQRYLELKNELSLSVGAFNDKHRHLTGNSTPHGLLGMSGLTRKVDVLAYAPEERERYFVAAEKTAYNLWRPSGLNPDTEGSCETVLEHIRMMIPDEIVRTHFLDTLGYLLQKPGHKIPHLFVLIGKQGNGKSLLFRLIRKLFGDHNTRILESDHLGMKYNAPLANRQVLMIEELKAADRLEVYNAIKTMITERNFIVEEKHVNVYEARTPDWVLASSNHSFPLAVEGNDRRVLAYESPLEPQGAEYYRALADAVEIEAGAILHFLLARDISRFDPNSPPPMTEAKLEIIRSSKPMLEQDIMTMIEDGHPLFWRDLVKMSDIQDHFQTAHKGTRPSNNVVIQALRSIGAINVGNVRLSTGPSRLWAIRNAEKWAHSSHEEIREHLSNLRPMAA